jgi:hypothetical protein
MSETKETSSPTPLTDQQRIAALEGRCAQLEEEMFLCLEFMRYRAEKEAEQRTSKITTKATPLA